MLLAPSVAALFKWRQFEPEMILLASGLVRHMKAQIQNTNVTLSGAKHPARRVINTDKHAGYPPAIAQLKAEGALEEIHSRAVRGEGLAIIAHRLVFYLNSQTHRILSNRAETGHRRSRRMHKS